MNYMKPQMKNNCSKKVPMETLCKRK